MIDIDSLQEYVEAAKEHGFVNEPCGMTYSQADEILTRLRQAENDAARYRWLRDSGVENLFSYQREMRLKYWDEDIDAEIGANNASSN